MRQRNPAHKRNLTTGDIGKLCGVNFRTVIRWIQRGYLAASSLPGRGDHRVTIPDFLAFLRENKMPIPLEFTEQMRRVVVATHDTRLAKRIEQALTTAGFEPHGAEDGFAAGALLTTLQPGVAIIDADLPGLGGVDAIRRLCGSLGATATLVVASTDQQEAMVQTGADAVIGRSAKVKDVVGRVSELAQLTPVEQPS